MSLSEATRKALATAPCSLRKLADEAGIPHSTLVRIQQGTLGASPEVARKLLKALRAWAKGCERGAEVVDGALRQGRPQGGNR